MSDIVAVEVTFTGNIQPAAVEVEIRVPGVSVSQASLPATIHAAAAKTTPALADELAIVDSAAAWILKKLTFASLKTWIESFSGGGSGTPSAHASTHATGGSDALTPTDIGAATTAQGAKADTALQQVPSLRVYDLAAQWCIDLSGVTTPGVNGRLINSDYVSGYTQWTSNGLSESVNIGNGAYTVLTRGGGRWNVRSYDDFNNKIYEAAYSTTFAGTDPTAQPYDVISTGEGTPVPEKVPVTASFIGQPYLRGAVMPFEVWEWNGTEWVQIEESTIPAANITDATTAGRSVLTAANAAAQRTAIDAAKASHSHASTLTDLGSGTPSSANFLRGDATWAVVSGVTTGAVDNAILRADGTGGATSQSSNCTIADSGQLSWPTGLGAITHVSGPTDQDLIISGGAVGGAAKSVVIKGQNSSVASSTTGNVSIIAGNQGGPNNYGGFVYVTGGSYFGSNPHVYHGGVVIDGGLYGTVSIKTQDIADNTLIPADITILAGKANYTGNASTTYRGANTLITNQRGANTAAAGTAGTGGGQTYTLGNGGDIANTSGSGIGGTGGSFTVTGGSGGVATGAGATHTGGVGSSVRITTGVGGNATGASGTRTGGNSGSITLGTGAAGTGATANGVAGSILLQIGGVTKFTLDGEGGASFASTLGVTGATTCTGLLTANGGILVAGYVDGSEMTAPAAPSANGYRIYAEDDGAGKTRLMVKFATGAAQQIAIEP